MPPSRKSERVRGRSVNHLVIITGMSGSGKASVLKAFEDLGYYCVDNLPVGLIPRFADLTKHSSEVEKAALVADIREGEQLKRLPKIIQSLRKQIKTTVVFLEASDDALLRRFSETRRPHPLGKDSSVKSALAKERKMIQPIRAMAVSWRNAGARPATSLRRISKRVRTTFHLLPRLRIDRISIRRGSLSSCSTPTLKCRTWS